MFLKNSKSRTILFLINSLGSVFPGRDATMWNIQKKNRCEKNVNIE